MIHNKEIGKRIREERQKLGLTRQELAEIIDLSDFYIGQLERGERQMSLAVLIKLSKCFHTTLDYIIFGITPSKTEYIQDPSSDYSLNKYTTDPELINLLNKCTAKEIQLFKRLIKTILPYMNNIDKID